MKSRLCFALLSALLLAPLPRSPLAQSAAKELVGVGGEVFIIYPGIPLTVVSRAAPPSREIAFRARSLGHASGFAQGIQAEATASSPSGESEAIGAHLRATADETLGLADATATGLLVEAVSTTPFSSMGSAIANALVARAIAGGESAGTVGIDVYSEAGGQVDGATGIVAVADAQIGTGILGTSTAPGLGIGVEGIGGDKGVLGMATDVTQGIGVEGSGPAYGVFASGDLGASGTKSFVQPHPGDPTRVVQFVCLEGNESGTYFRGDARLVDGWAELAIPEEWSLVTEEDAITVQLTPVGAPAVLYVAERGRDRIVVRGSPDCAFSYLVNGIRRGFRRYRPYRENRAFRPAVRGVPFGEQYPDELRDILVQNGILNRDYTPNEALARTLGWTLRSPDEVRAEERWWLGAAERRQRVRERVRAER